MLPRLVLRVRKAVRRLSRRNEDVLGLSGAANEARWQEMLSELEARERAAERRLAAAERALNRLSLN